MTDVAAGMVRPFGQKDRLDAAFEKFVVKFRRSSRRGDCGGDRQRGQNRHAHESTSRHLTLHQRRRRSSSDRRSNANLDKLELVPDKKRRIWRCTACPRRQLVDVAVGSTTELLNNMSDHASGADMPGQTRHLFVGLVAAAGESIIAA